MRRTVILLFLAGRLAGKHLGEILGGKVETFIDTGAAIVTLKNMDQPDIKERLQPDLDKYLKQ